MEAGSTDANRARNLTLPDGAALWPQRSSGASRATPYPHLQLTGRPNLSAADGAKLLMSRLCGQSGFLPAKWSVAQKPLQFLDCSLLLQGREDDQLHVRRVAHTKARIFEEHSSGRRVVDTLLAGKRPGHLAPGPPAGKLGAQARQTRDKALEIRVACVARAIGAEHGERRARTASQSTSKRRWSGSANTMCNIFRSSPSSRP
jgi:hypothetical protein